MSVRGVPRLEETAFVQQVKLDDIRENIIHPSDSWLAFNGSPDCLVAHRAGVDGLRVTEELVITSNLLMKGLHVVSAHCGSPELEEANGKGHVNFIMDERPTAGCQPHLDESVTPESPKSEGDMPCGGSHDESNWLMQSPDMNSRLLLSQYFEATLWLSKLAFDMMRAACRATLMLHSVDADIWASVHSYDDVCTLAEDEDLGINLDVIDRLLQSWWNPTYKEDEVGDKYLDMIDRLLQSRSNPTYKEGASSTDHKCHSFEGVGYFHTLIRNVKMQHIYFGDINTVDLVHLAKQLTNNEISRDIERVHFQMIAAWQLMREQFEGNHTFEGIKRADIEVGILRGERGKATTIHHLQLSCEPPTESEISEYEKYRECHRLHTQVLEPTLTSDVLNSGSWKRSDLKLEELIVCWDEKCDLNDCPSYPDNAAALISYLAGDMQRAACRVTLIRHGVPTMIWLDINTEDDLSIHEALKQHIPEVRRLLLSWWSPGINSGAVTDCDVLDGLKELYFISSGAWVCEQFFGNLCSSELLGLAKALKEAGTVDCLRRFYKLFAAWQLMRMLLESSHEFRDISRADKIIGMFYGMRTIPVFNYHVCSMPSANEIAKYETYRSEHFARAHDQIEPKAGDISIVTPNMNYSEHANDIWELRVNHNVRELQHKEALKNLAGFKFDLVRAACRATLMLHGVKPGTWSAVNSFQSMRSKGFEEFVPEAKRLLLSWWSPSANPDDVNGGLESLGSLDGLRLDHHFEVERYVTWIYYRDISTEDLLCLAKQLYYRDVEEGMRKCYRLFAAWQLMRWQFENGQAFKAIKYTDVILGILRGFYREPVTVADQFPFIAERPTTLQVAAYAEYKERHFKEHEAYEYTFAQLQRTLPKGCSNDCEDSVGLCLEAPDDARGAISLNARNLELPEMALDGMPEVEEMSRQDQACNEKECLPVVRNLQCAEAEPSRINGLRFLKPDEGELKGGSNDCEDFARLCLEAPDDARGAISLNARHLEPPEMALDGMPEVKEMSRQDQACNEKECQPVGGSNDCEDPARLYLEAPDDARGAISLNARHLEPPEMTLDGMPEVEEMSRQDQACNEKECLPVVRNLQILKSHSDIPMPLCNRGHGTSQTGGKQKSEGKGKPTFEEQHSRLGTQSMLINQDRYMYRPKGIRKKQNVVKHECRLRKEFASDSPQGIRKKQNFGKHACRWRKEAELTPVVFTKTPVEARGTEKITGHETNSLSIQANDGGNLLLKFCTLI